MGRLQDKVTIITGAGGGVGRLMARRFAEQGAPVVLAGRRAEALQETASLVAGDNLVVPTDITDEDQVVRLVESTVAKFGRVDVLLNNAAQPGKDRYIWEQTLENWNDTFAIDATGAMLCTREVLRQSMLDRCSGAIVNFSSTAGWKGMPRKSHYCVGKAALRTLTKVVAQEAGLYGIRVNCLVPGAIQTELYDNWVARIAAERGVAAEQLRDEFAAGSALRRVATPEQIADVAMFLASDASSAITGQSINVDSGSVLVG
jgi:NAD(P)-dependent dehydrogenase (short-subunit alcohol dehydrogenase family)